MPGGDNTEHTEHNGHSQENAIFLSFLSGLFETTGNPEVDAAIMAATATTIAEILEEERDPTPPRAILNASSVQNKQGRAPQGDNTPPK